MRSKALLPLAALPLATLGLALAAPGTAFAASGGSNTYMANLSPVPTNHVTGSGDAVVRLTGNTADVTVHYTGLLDASPHAMHFHAMGAGECPQASVAKKHNGHLSINTSDGAAAYGGVVTSLTTSGDTSPASVLAITRFPAKGMNTYHRTIQVGSKVAKQIRSGNAVVVVHGIDYNANGKYDNVLGASDLDPKLPSEATNPAICGALASSQMSSVPSGGAQTGGGSTSQGTGGSLALGGLALVGAAGALAYRRRVVRES